MTHWHIWHTKHPFSSKFGKGKMHTHRREKGAPHASRYPSLARTRVFFLLSCLSLTEIWKYMQSEVWKKNITKWQQFYLIIDIRWMISFTTIRCLCFAARIWDNVVLSLATLYPLPSGVIPASSPCITAALVLKAKKKHWKMSEKQTTDRTYAIKHDSVFHSF